MELDKSLPHNIDVEQMVLGTVLSTPSAAIKMVSILQPDMFYVDKHNTIFDAVSRVLKDDKMPDLIMVKEELIKMQRLEFVKMSYLIEISRFWVDDMNFENYCHIIIEYSIKRGLLVLLHTSTFKVSEQGADVFDVIDEMVVNIFKLSNILTSSRLVHASIFTDQNIKLIEKIRSGSLVLKGVPTGFIDIDNVIHGFQPGDFVTIAARPGMGKTAFMVGMINHIACVYKMPVAVFSIEMTANQLINRLVVTRTQILNERVKVGKYLIDQEVEQIKETNREINASEIYIDDSSTINVLEIRSRAMELLRTKQIKIMFVDYVQIMACLASRSRSYNREGEVSEISRGLKSIAKDLGIPVVAFAQLNREVEKRSSNIPKLSDLRESGALEQDSDIVMFIYRPEYYNPKDINGMPTHRKARIIIAKHRNGGLADIEMRFCGETMTFTDCDKLFYDEEAEKSDTPF